MLSRKKRERERGRVEDQRFRPRSGVAVLLLQLQHRNVYQDARIVGQPRGLRTRPRLHAVGCVRVHGVGRWSQVGRSSLSSFYLSFSTVNPSAD